MSMLYWLWNIQCGAGMGTSQCVGTLYISKGNQANTDSPLMVALFSQPSILLISCEVPWWGECLVDRTPPRMDRTPKEPHLRWALEM